TAGIRVRPDDLAQIVDALCNGDAGGQGIVEGRVGTIAMEKAVVATAVRVEPDDLSGVVDAGGQGGMERIQGIDNRGVSASTVEEAVDAGAGHIKAHDVTRGVDAECLGDGGQGIVQRREGLDWHGASWDRLGAKG